MLIRTPGREGTNREGKGRMENPPKPENSIYITGFPAEVMTILLHMLYNPYIWLYEYEPLFAFPFP